MYMINHFEREKFFKIYKVLLSLFVLGLSVLPIYLVIRYNHFVEQDEFLIFQPLRNGVSISLWNRLFSVDSQMLSKIPPFFGPLSKTPTESEITHLLLIYRVATFISISYFFFSIFFLSYQINKKNLYLNFIDYFFCFSIFLFLILNLIDRYSILFFDISIVTMYTNIMCSQLLLIAFLFCLLKNPSFKNYIFVSVFVLMSTIGIIHMIIYTGSILFAYIVFKYLKKRKVDSYIVFLLLFCIFLVFKEYFSTDDVAVKQDVYAFGVSDVHSLDRFIVYLKSTVEVVEIVFYKSIDKSRFILTFLFSVTLGYILFKKKIFISFLYFAYIIFVHFFFCFSIFWGGMADVTEKTSSLVIMYVYVSINLLLFYSYIFSLCLKKVTSILDAKDNVIFLLDLKKITYHIFFNSLWKNILILAFPFILFTYVGIFCVGIPTRTVIKDYVKGTARKYDSEVMSIYFQLSNSECSEEVITEVSDLPWSIGHFGLFNYEKYKSNTDYSKLPNGEWLIKYGQTMDTCVAPLFGKKHIEVIPRVEEE